MENNKNLKPWKKGQTGNPKGRPLKMYGKLNSDLKKYGVTPVSKHDYIDLSRYLFQMTEDDLKTISKDKSMPYTIRILADGLLDKKYCFQLLTDMRNWVFGREAKELEIMKPINITIVNKDDDLVNDEL